MSKKKSSANKILTAGIILALVLLGALGYWALNKFSDKSNDTANSQDDKDQSTDQMSNSRIVDGSRDDMWKYVNEELGFEFEFPKQVYGSMGCSLVNKDDNGDSVEPYYLVEDGMVDLTIIEHTDGQKFTVAQKAAPVFTNPRDEDLGYANCEVQTVTADNIGSGDLRTVQRTWHVISVNSADQAIEEFVKIRGLQDRMVGVEFDGPAGDKQEMGITSIDPPLDMVGGGMSHAWYYADNGKFVFIGIGQSYVFWKDSNYSFAYDDLFVDSFKLAD